MYKFWAFLMMVLVSACANEHKQPQPYVDVAYVEEMEMETEAEITPQVYALIATRTTNKMLDNSKVLYENLNRPTLFIMDPVKVEPSLPDGFYTSRKVTREIIEGSRTFSVVNNINDADYYLAIFIERRGNNDSPEIAYKLVLFNKQSQQIGEWVETIKRIRNDDRSWW